MMKPTFRWRRFLILLAIALGCITLWRFIHYARLARLNEFAAAAESQGAKLHGDFAGNTLFERLMSDTFGVYPKHQYERLFIVDLRNARDIDSLLGQITAADQVFCVKVGDDLHRPESLAHLLRLQHLTDLIIVAHNADDRWLETAARAPNLRRISVRDGRITDAGVRHLAGVRSLRILRIPDSAVTDEGLAALAGSRELEELDLRGSSITDASIPVLEALPHLADLNIVRTKISAKGAERLSSYGLRRVLH